MLLSGSYAVFPGGIFRFGPDESNDCHYYCATAITTTTLQLTALRAKTTPRRLFNKRGLLTSKPQIANVSCLRLHFE